MLQNKQEAAELLAEDVLSHIELRDIELSAVMLKCARLARLLGDQERQRTFTYEAGGYPTEAHGVSAEVFELGRKAGRVYTDNTSKEDPKPERIRVQSVEVLEQLVRANHEAIPATADRPVSISSANPSQFVMAPVGNEKERSRLIKSTRELSEFLARSRALAYDYASSVLYELQFSSAASAIFSTTRERIDQLIIKYVPAAAEKTRAMQENLTSSNPEDWANAVHGCRRLLQAVADEIYPARDPKSLPSGKTVKLGPDNYINRLMSFVDETGKSQTHDRIIGSTLDYMGNRLDALFAAAQKGSHASISTREEAERYVVYTFMVLGDILTLKDA